MVKVRPKAIEAVYPQTSVQLCLVHQVRGSLNYVSWKQRKEVAADLKPIYQAATVEQAEQRLDDFAAKWDGAYPTISQMWRRNWEHLPPFFAYPADIRKVIYTTNAVESLNMSLRKVIKTRGSFPNQEAAFKLLCQCKIGRRRCSASPFCSVTGCHHLRQPNFKRTSKTKIGRRIFLGRGSAPSPGI